MNEDIEQSHITKHYDKLPKNVVTTKTVCNRMQRCVNIAKALFNRGADSGGRTFNVTFAIKKSKILAIGLNDHSRVMIGYNRKLKTNYKYFGEDTYKPALHSEISAILKLGHEDCSDICFYNVRLNKKCECSCSQPCSNCMRIFKMINAKHIYFYNNEQEICEV